jgi:protein TonB
MEPKKNENADLEPKRGTFYLIGMVCSLMFVLAIFKIGSGGGEQANLGVLFEDVEQIEIPQTEQKVKPPPPPPPPVLKVVEDTEILDEEEDIIEETEVDENTAIDIPDVEPVEEVEEDQIFMVVEDMPAFPGGEQKMFEYIGQNTVYPQLARESGVTGIVHVYFVVGKDGKVDDVRVLRGIGGGCDEEAVRVVKSMPRWTPGKQRGKPVKVQYTIPIRFFLR